MKLKKAMREYARAVDDLAFATNAIILADMDSCSPEVFGALVHWRDEARKEKKRAVRQMHAVMSAMQYRGKQTDVMEYLNCNGFNTVTALGKYDLLFTYMRRLSYGVSSQETKRKLAKRACEHYLQYGDMEKRRYYVESEYYSFFGVKVSLLEHDD